MVPKIYRDLSALEKEIAVEERGIVIYIYIWTDCTLAHTSLGLEYN